MSSSALIFDRNLYLKKRSLSADSLYKADFLIKHSLADILDRLSSIQKKFPRILNLGCRNGYGSSELRRRSGTELVIETENVCSFFKDQNNINRVIFDEEFLPFKENSFDLIISVLNLHNINDLPGCLLQLKKSLKPDGVIIASIFGENNLPELRSILIKTEAEIYSGISPRMKPSIDMKQLGGLLQRAGFSSQIVDKERIEVHYSSPIKLLKDLKFMAETNILSEKNKRYIGKDFWLKFYENYYDSYNNNGSCVANFEILIFTALK